jgi:hypothetical protein
VTAKSGTVGSGRRVQKGGSLKTPDGMRAI